MCDNHISQSLYYYASFRLMIIFFLVHNETLHCGYKFIFPNDNKTGTTQTHTHTRPHSPEYLKYTTNKTTNRMWTHVNHAYNFLLYFLPSECLLTCQTFPLKHHQHTTAMKYITLCGMKPQRTLFLKKQDPTNVFLTRRVW